MCEVWPRRFAYVQAYMLTFIYAEPKHDRAAGSAHPRPGRSHAIAAAESDRRPRDLRLLSGGTPAHEPAKSVAASGLSAPRRNRGFEARRKMDPLPIARTRRSGGSRHTS